MASVKCPSCKTNFRGNEQLAGKRVKCPKCGHRFEHPPFSESVALPIESSGFQAAAPSIPSSSTSDRVSDVPAAFRTENLTVQHLGNQWQARKGVILSQAKCYGCGIGSEYVYCYSYPTHLELADLKKDKCFRIKVGSASGDPIERICQQFAGNKTALSEPPIVLLLFQTLSARHLERWLHKRLNRVQEAAGTEWFVSNLEELIELYGEYLREASRHSDEVSTPDMPAKERKVQEIKSVTSNFARAGPATSGGDVVVFIRPCLSRKPTAELRSKRKRQGHRIHEVLERLGRVSVNGLCEETGYSVIRVLDHVNWAIKLGLAKLDTSNAGN